MHDFQVFCGSVFSFHIRMSLAKMLASVNAIMTIYMSWARVVGEPEASAMVEYSLMAWNMVAIRLA